MKNMRLAVVLGSMFWISNVSAGIVSYNISVTSDSWSTGIALPFGVAAQPTFNGTLKLDNTLSGSGALVDFRLVTGSQTFTKAMDAGGNGFGFDSQGNLTWSVIGLGSNGNNMLLTTSPSGGSSFMLNEGYAVPPAMISCSDCVSFSRTSSLLPKVHQNFGLFIGVRDYGTGLAGIPTFDIRSDDTAQQLADKFNSMPNSKAYALTRDLTKGETISYENIQSYLDLIKLKIQTGDTLVVYAGSHGASFTPDGFSWTVTEDGTGNEYLDLQSGGGVVSLGSPGLTDRMLTTLLREVPEFNGVNKLALIDSCHSGGFWSSGDPFEEAADNLDSLSKIALFAASSEAGISWGVGTHSLFGNALMEAWTINPKTGKYYTDSNGDGSLDQLELRTFLESKSWLPLTDFQMFPMGFGDFVDFDPSLIQFEYRASSDFNGDLYVSSIPEPGTLALLAIGLVGFAGQRRWKRI